MSRTSEVLSGLREQNEPATFQGRSGFWVQADCVFVEASCPQYAIDRYREQFSAFEIACSHNLFCSDILRIKGMNTTQNDEPNRVVGDQRPLWFLISPVSLTLWDKIKLLLGWKLYVKFHSPNGECSAACENLWAITRSKTAEPALEFDWRFSLNKKASDFADALRL